MNNDPLPRPPTGYLGLGRFVAYVLQHLALDAEFPAGPVVGPPHPANLDGPV